MRATTRLVWKQHRFELVAILGALVVLTILTLGQWARLRELEPSAECQALWWLESRDGPGCDVESWGQVLQVADGFVDLITVLPLVGGAVLGSLLVAREVEHRTAQLAWSLGPSRSRWLAERVLPVVVPFALALAGLAVATELAVAAKGPDVDPRQSFQDYGARGLPLLLRGAAAFAIALLAGAMLGRQVPAILVGGAAAMLTLLTLNAGFPYGAKGEWETEIPPNRLGKPDRFFKIGYRMQDGRYVTWDQALAEAPTEAPYPDLWVYENVEEVAMLAHGPLLTEVELRESLLLGIVMVGGLAGAVLVVARRRPY